MTLARILLFHKLLIKVVKYSLVLSKESTFLYIGQTFAHFRPSGKVPVFDASFTDTVTVSITKSHFLK